MLSNFHNPHVTITWIKLSHHPLYPLFSLTRNESDWFTNHNHGKVRHYSELREQYRVNKAKMFQTKVTQINTLNHNSRQNIHDCILSKWALWIWLQIILNKVLPKLLSWRQTGQAHGLEVSCNLRTSVTKRIPLTCHQPLRSTGVYAAAQEGPSHWWLHTSDTSSCPARSLQTQ